MLPARPPSRRLEAAAAVLTFTALLCAQTVRGYYLPGTYPREFLKGAAIQAEVNSLTSSDTELPYNYYSLPFCQPVEGVKKSASASINPGTILAGSNVQNSPYNFSILVEERAKTVCKPENYHAALTERQARDFQEKISQRYRVRMILDNLPVTAYDLAESPESIRPGFELGYEVDGKYYVNNHLSFTILYHKTNGQYTRAQQDLAEIEAASVVEGGARKLLRWPSFVANSDVSSAVEASAAAAAASVGLDNNTNMFMIVGFEVTAVCSLERQPGQAPKDVSCSEYSTAAPTPQQIKTGAKVVYTYDVHWVASEVSWASRWDAYLKMPGGRVHWFSILNSLMVVLVMSSIVAMIMMRTIRRDLARYEGLLGDTGPKDDAEESGWKMVSGDVFRPPPNATLLCVQVGSGVQIIASAFMTLFFAALGFLSPASRGALLTALMFTYLLLAVAAGFAAIWLYGMIMRTYTGWKALAWKVASYFPGITLFMLTALNVVIHRTGSSGAIPLGAFFSLIALWFIISIPLCFSGGVLATRQEIKPYPTRTNQIPRHVPPPHWASHPAVLFLAAGLLPYGTIFVEMYFAMTSIWQGYFYYIFGFCFMVGALTVLITIEVAVVCTYVQLCAEDYHWWWRSFYRGGSVTVYMGLYCIVFLVGTLHSLSGPLSITLYMSYMALILWGLYLALATVGFLSSFLFVYSIFSAVKAD